MLGPVALYDATVRCRSNGGMRPDTGPTRRHRDSRTGTGRIRSDEQAEGMSGRVEEHPDALLRLHRRERRPGLDGVLGGLVEVIDEDVQVLRRVLHSGLTRP